MISFIWAQDQNGVIGNNNALPWRLPEDLKFFKETTMGHSIVMGRKTFESIGKPLPGRENIILTRDNTYKAEGCIVFHSVDEILQYANQAEKEVIITGGSEVFALFMSYVDKLYVTRIHETFQGDTFFPSIDWDQFELVWTKEGIQNEKNPYSYEFQLYKRK